MLRLVFACPLVAEGNLSFGSSLLRVAIRALRAESRVGKGLQPGGGDLDPTNSTFHDYALLAESSCVGKSIQPRCGEFEPTDKTFHGCSFRGICLARPAQADPSSATEAGFKYPVALAAAASTLCWS